MELMVHERRDEADGVVSLTLVRADGADLPAWSPGAHVDVHLTASLTRQYSLCSDPGDRRRWRIGVLREPGGRGGSQYVLDKVHAGDIVEVGAPRNHFELVRAPRYVFVAGGIGITPILPMVAQAERDGADWTLLHGGRSRTSMAFTAELARYGGRVTIAPQDEVGLPDLDTLLAVPRADTAVYACGPGPLLDAVAERTAAWPAGCLHVERFAPAAHRDTAPGETFVVEFAASGVRVTVGPDRSILAAAQAAGVRADFSCGEGTCGSCEAPLLAGHVDHRDSVLDDDEREAQDCLMICVSRAGPGCPVLRIDL
ncbi:PDR/VanB family oxidoreductase [Pseudonocardia sp. ICBG1293]|uniref:PDR/VanB family oxidoreductase n=1 Tax=Pseudonocardia sp. ICBG1293 TaxID=2844382 RepID=UPI001CC9B89F|nr:PDR/VanB family oxidoreductase [Pseudonocardia sp. ICBG1293]